VTTTRLMSTSSKLSTAETMVTMMTKTSANHVDAAGSSRAGDHAVRGDALRLAIVRLKLQNIPYRLVTADDFPDGRWPMSFKFDRCLLVCDYRAKGSTARYFYITPDGVEHDYSAAHEEHLLRATRALDPTLWIQSGGNS
jgi:hypothetical protein